MTDFYRPMNIYGEHVRALNIHGEHVRAFIMTSLKNDTIQIESPSLTADNVAHTSAGALTE